MELLFSEVVDNFKYNVSNRAQNHRLLYSTVLLATTTLADSSASLARVTLGPAQKWSYHGAERCEEDIRQLCDLFDISFFGVRQRYRDIKEHPEIPVTDGLLKLQQAVKSLAVSSAVCERRFSEMNMPLWTQLQINKVSACSFLWLGLLWTSGIQKNMSRNQCLKEDQLIT